MTDLAIIEIAPDLAPTLYVENGLESFLEQIREAVKEVPDLSTAKGRARVASLAAQVSRSKTAVEKPGRDYLKRLKEQPKVVEAELRRFVTECDNLRDEVRRPLTEWEEEQERIKAEEEAKKKAEELAAKVEADHEMALLMNANHDREVAEKKAEADRQRIAHEEELKRQATEQAKRDAERKAAAELAAAQKREADAIAAKAQAELLAKQAAERAEQDRLNAIAKAEADAKAAAEKAEKDKQDAIEAERMKAKQAEEARLAEQKRIADEEARRAADIEHRRAINRQVIADLVSAGLPEEFATEALKAIASGKVSNTMIKY
ncbi:hypothetical protein FEK48_13300 [Escherichia sp. E2593]|uniref:hypothetical protein n=1 Tax=unclassified Escherichia TaxID=2608889 RepID=UPI00102A9500|nr:MULTISPECIES: hypothetical protein [unclassified Escherichia]RZN40421.1 hypothetical protein D9738_13370 [Escherichia sp. E10V5]TGC06850.1 hypothetical protein CRG93_18620 [Escherichia sp. E2593]TLI81927.1 hypothetical protein FEK48_13300 [Escherichia sp. E2593]